MQALFRRIERVARIDIPVLILGETGTGKELVAKALQQLSPRRERRFEIVNCGGLVRELLLSELFGHERGSFTGAVARREGLLKVADGGTVFLDEIGELPPDAQAMLLRFVQQGEIRPVGSPQTLRVNVRLIAATHRDLAIGIESGTFREDLYYRLRRVILEVPPLGARREDIPLLVEHIRVNVNTRHRLAIEGVTGDAVALIRNAPCPGNVRELEAVLEEAMILRGEGWLELERRDVNLRLNPFRAWPPLTGTVNTRRMNSAFVSDLTRLQREALRLTAERQEVRRGDFMARCGISRAVAKRELAGLVRAGLLWRRGSGRGVRYVLSELSGPSV